MARKNKSRFAVLGILSQGGAMSGYDVKKAIETSIGHFWSESFGQIYPMLKQLEREKLVRSKDATEAGSERERRAYAITPAGRAALAAYLDEPPEASALRDETLLKLFFGRVATPGRHLEYLEAQRRSTSATLEIYRGIQRDIEKSARAGHPDAPYWLITLRKGLLGAEYHLRWLDESIQSLRRFAAKRPASGRGAKSKSPGTGE